MRTLLWPWVLDPQQRKAQIGRWFPCGWCAKDSDSNKE